jgi:hypothetical protein
MTAVKWLENQIKNSKYFYKLMEDINSRSTIAQSNIFEQAKAMEKEQIVDAYEYTAVGTSNYGEQYYNETFKSE